MRPTSKEVFEAHAPFVWRAVRYLGVHERDLPDVAQEVFLVVHRRLDTFEGRSSVRTWLYGICLRVVRDHRARAWVRREMPVEEVPDGVSAATQEDDVERSEARGLLLAALGGLDDDKRAVFVLHDVEELSMSQVIEVVGCPLQTAYTRLHAARRHIEAALVRGGLRGMDR